MLKKRIVNIFIILGLLSFSVLAVEQVTPRNDIPGLTNFYKVSDSLYRGAQPEVNGFAELKKIGIKTIINLRANHSDVEMIKGLGFQYINIPINTWDIDDKDVAVFLKVVLDPNNQPVFVHCQHGSDRTGTMAAIYRMYVQNWPREKALKELPVFGFHKIWLNLKMYLKKIDMKNLKSQVEKRGDVKIEFVK